MLYCHQYNNPYPHICEGGSEFYFLKLHLQQHLLACRSLSSKPVKVCDQDPSDLPSLQNFYEVNKRAQSPSETYALVPAAD